MIKKHKNFGKMTAHRVEIEVEGQTYKYLSFQNANGVEWQDLVAQFGPFDFYIAATDEGRIVSMESDPDASQLADLEIIGINVSEDFNFTNGPGGTVYGKLWDGSAIVDPSLTPTLAAVDHERGRRIDGGFSFNGVRFQSRPQDRENITGAAIAALAAITAGAQAGDYRWHGGNTDFTWIAEDNTLHPMDAQTMFAFGQAAMAHKQALIFAARQLKDMDVIPENYQDDEYWVTLDDGINSEDHQDDETQDLLGKDINI